MTIQTVSGIRGELDASSLQPSVQIEILGLGGHCAPFRWPVSAALNLTW